MTDPSSVEGSATIVNPMGLHARPAAQLVQLAGSFESEIVLRRDTLEVNGKSIMGVLMLAAEAGTELFVRAHGSDAETALGELLELIRDGFGER